VTRPWNSTATAEELLSRRSAVLALGTVSRSIEGQRATGVGYVLREQFVLLGGHAYRILASVRLHCLRLASAKTCFSAHESRHSLTVVSGSGWWDINDFRVSSTCSGGLDHPTLTLRTLPSCLKGNDGSRCRNVEAVGFP